MIATSTSLTKDDQARRAYWADQMQLGYEFVQRLLSFPVQESGERFASIQDAAADANVEMQFSTTKIGENLDRIYFMRESLVRDVVAIGKAMNDRGWILRIEDGFRTLAMQSELVRKPALFDAILEKCIWENGGEIPPAEMVFRRAIVLIANIPKIGTHMSGSAIDISVFHRDDGREVWRGGPYLTMSECTPMRSPFIESDVLENRLAITSMMEAHGLMHYPFEFWHFSKGDAIAHLLTGDPSPARYGAVHWDPSTNEIATVADPLTPLNPLGAIEAEIAAAISRSSTRESERSSERQIPRAEPAGA